MSEVRRVREIPPPAALPFLLSFVAGYVDSYTYLTLFGLFVAQVTSSFVIAGAELVTKDYGVAGKLLVLAVFLLATAATAGLIGALRHHGRPAMAPMLALEAVLLAAFVTIVLFGPPIGGADDWRGIVAGLFAAGAMGAQSVLVRLLMKGVPQTNVMTGNMTQLGIAVTDLVLVWRRLRRSAHGPEDIRAFEVAREQLLLVLSVAGGFLIGAGSGALAFATTRQGGAVLAVGIVAFLALWAFCRERAA